MMMISKIVELVSKYELSRVGNIPFYEKDGQVMAISTYNELDNFCGQLVAIKRINNHFMLSNGYSVPVSFVTVMCDYNTRRFEMPFAENQEITNGTVQS